MRPSESSALDGRAPGAAVEGRHPVRRQSRCGCFRGGGASPLRFAEQAPPLAGCPSCRQSSCWATIELDWFTRACGRAIALGSGARLAAWRRFRTLLVRCSKVRRLRTSSRSNLTVDPRSRSCGSDLMARNWSQRTCRSTARSATSAETRGSLSRSKQVPAMKSVSTGTSSSTAARASRRVARLNFFSGLLASISDRMSSSRRWITRPAGYITHIAVEPVGGVGSGAR